LDTPLPHHGRTSEIVAYAFWMKKEGYSETTIERYVRLLKALAKRVDLLNPESVKEALTRTDWSEATKEMACGACAIFSKQHRLAFVPSRYRRVDKLPFIPLGSEVELLIAAMRLRTSTFLSLLKDTGARSLEVWTLKWGDMDFQCTVESWSSDGVD